jgi:hypothetical protein
MFPETVPAPNYSAPLLNFKAASPGQQQPQQQPQQAAGFLPKLQNGQIDFRKIATDLQNMGQTAGGAAQKIGQNVGGLIQGIGNGVGSIAQGAGNGAAALVNGGANGIAGLLGL